MKATDPKLADAITKLREAQSECDALIEEVEKYDSSHESYPLGLGLPYPEEDIDHFHNLAKQAQDLRTRIVAILDGLGGPVKELKEQIRATDLTERYIPRDPLARNAKRPSRSGLRAAREVIETACQVLGKTDIFKAQASGSSVKRTSKRGPTSPIETFRQVAEIVGQYGPNWPKNYVSLDSICHDLDQQKIPTPKAWGKWKPKPHGWVRALDYKERPVIQAIEYRLKRAAESLATT